MNQNTVGVPGHALEKTEVGPYHKEKYIWRSGLLAMLCHCMDLWVPQVFRQGELALSSMQRKL